MKNPVLAWAGTEKPTSLFCQGKICLQAPGTVSSSAFWRDSPLQALPFTLCSLHRLTAGWRGPSASYTSDIANLGAGGMGGGCKCHAGWGVETKPNHPKIPGQKACTKPTVLASWLPALCSTLIHLSIQLQFSLWS